jgi:hypothetical protein
MRLHPAPERALSLIFASALALVGCGEDDLPAVTPPPTPPRPPAPIVSGRAIADTAAFALAATSQGALLVYGAPMGDGGGVRAIQLGPVGEALDVERPITSRGAAGGGAAEDHVSQVVEVAAASVGDRVGLAWVVDYGRELRTQSAFSPDGGRRFEPPSDLGQTVRVPAGRGGRLAMGGSPQGTVVLYHRMPEAPCVASAGTCALVMRTGVGSSANEATRGTEPLEVQHPCEPFVGDVIFHDGSWYHSLCHQDPRPTATTYAIRPALSWAGTFEADAGCVPAGLAPLDDGVAVLLDCAERRRAAVQLDEMGRPRTRFASPTRSASCEEGRPVLALTEGASQRKLRLGAVADHLEGLLPSEVAPPGSRAVWTGEALLIAVPAGRELSLRRYQCVGDRFDRTDLR